MHTALGRPCAGLCVLITGAGMSADLMGFHLVTLDKDVSWHYSCSYHLHKVLLNVSSAETWGGRRQVIQVWAKGQKPQVQILTAEHASCFEDGDSFVLRL